MAGIKEAIEYEKAHPPNPDGRATPCPRCKGGLGASDRARKKKLPPIKNQLCFTCWCWTKNQDKTAKPKPVKITPTVKKMFKKSGRKFTIRRGR